MTYMQGTYAITHILCNQNPCVYNNKHAHKQSIRYSHLAAHEHGFAMQSDARAGVCVRAHLSMCIRTNANTTRHTLLLTGTEMRSDTTMLPLSPACMLNFLPATYPQKSRKAYT